MNASEEEQSRATRVVSTLLERDGFSQWLGIEIVDVWPHSVVVRATIRDEMANGFGMAHGGIVFSIADSALAFASNTSGKVAVSIENAITYPAPVHVGDVLTAIAERESESSRLGYYRVVIRNQKEEVVALFRGTVYKTKGEHDAA